MVSFIGSLVHQLVRYLDYELQQHVQEAASYVRNAGVPMGSLLISKESRGPST